MTPEEKREIATQMRSAGCSNQEIGRAIGCTGRHSRRYWDPDYREAELVASREAKQRRAGACVDCGTPTKYGGQPGSPVNRRCPKCAPMAARRYDHDRIVALRRSGMTQTRIAAEVGCTQTHVAYVLAGAGMSVGRGGRLPRADAEASLA